MRYNPKYKQKHPWYTLTSNKMGCIWFNFSRLNKKNLHFLWINLFKEKYTKIQDKEKMSMKSLIYIKNYNLHHIWGYNSLKDGIILQKSNREQINISMIFYLTICCNYFCKVESKKAKLKINFLLETIINDKTSINW